MSQLQMERTQPKADLLLGGTGDVHLIAAEQNLTQKYQSPLLPQLYDWAQLPARSSGMRTVGIYSGPLGFAYNTEVLARKKLPVPRTWRDLLHPQYRGEIHAAHPMTSGTAYTMIATLVQRMGEDAAFDYLTQLHKNIANYHRSGVGAIKAVARGEAAISISFLHDGPGEKAQGYPLETIAPSDGTSLEIGSMSIVQGARNLKAAIKFYDWALTPAAQALGAASLQFQLPSNRATKLDPRIPALGDLQVIPLDHARFGQSSIRSRLLQRWEREVNRGR